MHTHTHTQVHISGNGTEENVSEKKKIRSESTDRGILSGRNGELTTGSLSLVRERTLNTNSL